MNLINGKPSKDLTCKANAIFVDLGGVFTHPEGHHKLGPDGTGIPFRRVLVSSTWMEYEKGKISEEECFRLVAEEYSFPVENLSTMVQKFRKTIPYDQELVSIFRKIKDSSSVKIYLVSNISNPDYAALLKLWGDEFWSLFDRVFTSATIGERKPSLKFYRHVLRATGTRPQDVIYVDDLPENNLAAASMGIRSTFGIANLERTLLNMLYDPIERGQQYLKRHAKNHITATPEGEVVDEVFTQLLILDATEDADLVDIQPHSGLWNYFTGKPQYTTATFPYDLDTTTLALSTLGCTSDEAHSVLDEILKFRSEDGFFEAYFDKSRPRIDAAAAINGMTFFYMHGRGYDASETLEWTQNILLNRAYLQGTRYYSCGEWILYYVYRLLSRTDDPVVHEKLKGPLKARIAERVGAEGDSICLAMRLIVCNYVGIVNIADRERLLSWQLEDGGWELSFMYALPVANKKLGNRGTTTAFAVKALQGFPEGL